MPGTNTHNWIMTETTIHSPRGQFVKEVSTSGQVSLGTRYAGETVRVVWEVIDDE